MKISIPNPCHVPLTEMKPVEGGFYCSSCAHNVTDFRDWDEKDIRRYFKNLNGKKACGIFKNTQLAKEETPTIVIVPKVNATRLRDRQVFLYALLVCFGTVLFSCGSQPEHGNGGLVIQNEYLDSLKTLNYSSQTGIDSLETDMDTVTSKKNSVKCSHEYSEFLETTVGAPVLETVEPPEEEKLVGVLTYSEPPEFPGGQAALAKIIYQNLTYPRYEKKRKIEGTVHAQITIDEDGNAGDITILKSVEGAINFDAEAIRVLKLMPKWKPARDGGRPVKMTVLIPIEFKLMSSSRR